MAEKITVRLGDRSYPILIRSGSLGQAGARIREVSRAGQALILSTPPVYARYGGRLRRSLAGSFGRVSHCLVPDGEAHKNEKTLFSVFRRMQASGLHRDGCVVALGGGVVGDLAGLAASLYMRGTDFVQVPTTLLAQVDASMGGKTAIDFGGIKNLIGSFYQPKMVLVDPDVLRTLDDRQLRTGLAEIIKYGVIRDADLFDRLEKGLSRFFAREPEFLALAIRRSAAIKADIISRDEREGGKRMWLNYGHTLGHA
ncbi:MAG TPA: 3-dehydroquinate synthase family protein, partial [bacterium]|nr:3-dehydroquinate synthase family protein [bacterium]